jgi:hypothetical protein
MAAEIVFGGGAGRFSTMSGITGVGIDDVPDDDVAACSPLAMIASLSTTADIVFGGGAGRTGCVTAITFNGGSVRFPPSPGSASLLTDGDDDLLALPLELGTLSTAFLATGLSLGCFVLDGCATCMRISFLVAGNSSGLSTV